MKNLIMNYKHLLLYALPLYSVTFSSVAEDKEYSVTNCLYSNICLFARQHVHWIRSYAEDNNITISNDLEPLLRSSTNNLAQYCERYEEYYSSHKKEYDDNAYEVSFNRLCQHPLKEIYATYNHYNMAQCRDIGLFADEVIESLQSNSVLLASSAQMRFLFTAPCSLRSNRYISVISPTMFFDTSYMAYIESYYGDRFSYPDIIDYIKVQNEAKEKARQGLLSKQSYDILTNPTSSFTHIEIGHFNSELLKLFVEMNNDSMFYYEEYFAFPWTYDYLTPNNLIMILDRKKNKILCKDSVSDNHDFWSKYLAEKAASANLLDSAYMCDFLAKLRLSFANLYRHHRLGYDAERAYIQSYLIAPENIYINIALANFFVEIKRHNYAIYILYKLKKHHPKDTRIDSVINNIEHNKSYKLNM